ncbi:MAG: TIGR01777 family oxidoreductase [Alphaproteobacteria bacterium]
MKSPTPHIAVITGSSGLIGHALSVHLAAQGWLVRHLVRHEPTSPTQFYWNPERGECDVRAFAGAAALFHLAGENIAAGRWTEARKRTLLLNRQACMSTLHKALAAAPDKPACAIFASAVGYYGTFSKMPVDETAPVGQGFAAKVCQGIEAFGAVAGVRTVYPRLGVVLATHGGALAKMLPAFRLGLGGKLGKGTQPFAWISLPDAVNALVHLAQSPQLEGAVNLVAPATTSQQEFAQALGYALHRPSMFPMPAWVAKLLFGEMGEELLLQGVHVLPAKLQNSGFVFQQPTLVQALQNIK